MIAAKINQNIRPASYRQSGDFSGKGERLSLANSMQGLEPPHLKYNITRVDGGVLLSIWEPAPKSDIRVKPFLFMTRHRLTSELEAKKLLAHYLSVYKRATQRS